MSGNGIFLFIALAAIGTVIRAALAGLETEFNRQLLATAAVNILGAFALGALVNADADTITVLGVGGLGSLTTFSTYVSQIECINRRAKRRDAVLYAVGTIVAGIAAAWVGLQVG